MFAHRPIFIENTGKEELMNNNKAIISGLPDKLKKLRQGRGLSQGQLGNKLGVNVQLISKYERGVVCPPTNMVVKIASEFNVSLDYLLRDEANVAINKIKSRELLKHIEEIEQLPEEDQQVLTSLLDAFIKKYKFEQLARA